MDPEENVSRQSEASPKIPSAPQFSQSAAQGSEVSALQSPAFEQQLIASMVKEFEEKTGFPAVAHIPEFVKAQAKAALLEAANALGVRVLHSSYSSLCSLERGVPVPPLDLDNWIVLADYPLPDESSWFSNLPFFKQEPEFSSQQYRSVEKRLKSRIVELIDPDLIRLESGPTVVWKGELDYVLGAYPWGNEVPFEATDAETFLKSLFEGESLIDGMDIEELHSMESHPLHKEFQGKFRANSAVSFEVRPKHAEREKLLDQYDDLSPREKFVVHEILRHDSSNGQHPEVLSLDPQNRFTKDLQSLQERDLLVLLDPDSDEFKQVREETYSRVSWMIKEYINQFTASKLIAPWRPFWGDEQLLLGIRNPDFVKRLEANVENAAYRDVLPKGLNHDPKRRLKRR